ncbi:MAG: haloacid dehalogenase [Flavobacteriaceae bacterium]|nr:MAG: haloacid dehalogenase [Flavobacteriaceae bacterium]
MAYKLICSDIDGTLLNVDRELSQSTIEQVQRVSPIPFILISSRMPAAMHHLQRDLKNESTPLIAYNGGLVIADNQTIHSTFIAPNMIQKVADQCKENSVHLSLYFNDEWYVPSMDFWAKREANNTKVTPAVKPTEDVINTWIQEEKGAHKIMCMGDENEIDILYNYLKNNYADQIHLYRSKPTYIEISHKAISKKTAIEMLLEHTFTTINMEEIIAFGDNFNDIEMLEAVGMGVAVANAQTQVLEIANMVTDTNKNDGVAKAIKELF